MEARRKDAIPAADVAALRRAFDDQIADVVSDTTVAQSLAARDAAFGRRRGEPRRQSERVVRSHLRFLREFPPFRDGDVTKRSVYRFMFHAIVERRLRVTYVTRVIKSILSYLRAGRGEAVARLTAESLDYLRDARGIGVRPSRFYEKINALADSAGSDAAKRVVAESRAKRTLVFSDEEESGLLRHCESVLKAAALKYGGAYAGRATPPSHHRRVDIDLSRPAAETDARSLERERALFEFALVYTLGFLSGARVKSTLLRMSYGRVAAVLSGGAVECFTKGAYADVFLPRRVLRDNDFFGSVTAVRRNRILYAGAEPAADGPFFTSTDRRLELMFDTVFRALFGRRRTRGVRWHSQRRRYLGAINDRYGVVAASESVGHGDVATTMLYINNSLHTDDVRRKAGAAITERYVETRSR